MASCEPMASPSGRTCETITKRWRVRMASAIPDAVGLSRGRHSSSVGRGTSSRSASVCVAASGGRVAGAMLGGCVVRVEVAEDLLDPVLMRDRFVETELELGHPAQLQPGADVAAEERRGTVQGARRSRGAPCRRRARCRTRAPSAGPPTPCTRVSVMKPMPGSCTVPAAEQLAQRLANLVADAIRSVSLCHCVEKDTDPSCLNPFFLLPYVRNSSSVRMVTPGSTRSISSAAARSCSSTCSAVVEMATMPSPARCHKILVLNFRDGDVQLLQPILDPPQHHAFVLQRLRVGQEQLDGQHGNHHW